MIYSGVFLISFSICFLGVFTVVKIFKNIINPVRSYVPKTEAVKEKVSPFGGAVMFASALLSCIFFVESRWSMILFLPVFLMLCLGIIDDLTKVFSKKYNGISAKKKFLAQNIICLLVCYFAFRINPQFTNFEVLLPFLGAFKIPSYILFSFIISYFAFNGTVNAVNLTDGLDGLAAKQCLVIIAFLAAVLLRMDFSYIDYNMQDLQLILFAFMGALLAFLFFNSSPAKIFMGDAGSMMLGTLIASVCVLLRLEFLLIFVGFIIFIEALSVIMQVSYFKITKGKRIFKMTPIHHHFQLNGMKEQKITEVAFLITILLAVLFSSSLF